MRDQKVTVCPRNPKLPYLRGALDASDQNARTSRSSYVSAVDKSCSVAAAQPNNNSISSLPLLIDNGWRQYETAEQAQRDHDRRIRRLVRHDACASTGLLLNCKDHFCGQDTGVNPRSILSGCNAVCRVAQFHFEINQAPQIARLLSKIDRTPWFVTVVNPQYWIPLDQLPSFSLGAIKQSIARALSRLPAVDSRKPVVAVGRVDFDLSEPSNNLQIRPHIHLIVANANEISLRNILRPRINRDVFPNLIPVLIKPISDIGALRYATKCKLKGLPKSDRVPPNIARARSRTSASAEEKFDRWLVNLKLGDLLVLYGLRRSGNSLRYVE